jgi:hypothetical protein
MQERRNDQWLRDALAEINQNIRDGRTEHNLLAKEFSERVVTLETQMINIVGTPENPNGRLGKLEAAVTRLTKFRENLTGGKAVLGAVAAFLAFCIDVAAHLWNRVPHK